MTLRSPVEPEPGATARFVVHEHYATTHHFDLRLEGPGVDGSVVLWSWALPKGLPTDPATNRLAVRVEDHDIDHIDFVDETPVEGVDGADGAIAKSIWDHGTYAVDRSSSKRFVFDLIGERGSARYALIHTGGDDWIMHLME